MGALQPNTGSHPTPHAGPEAPASHGGTRMHITVAIALAVLTIISFAMVGSGSVPNTILIPVILVLAMAQIALQVLYYMHLKWDSRVFAGFFLAALGLAILISLIVKTLIVL